MANFQVYAPNRAGRRRIEDAKIRGVLIYGPQGCGKTRNADLFVEHFRKKRVMEDWNRHDVPADVVALTSLDASGVPGAIHFWEAMLAVCNKKLGKS